MPTPPGRGSPGGMMAPPTRVSSINSIPVVWIPAPLGTYGGTREPVNLIVIHDIEGNAQAGIAELLSGKPASVHMLADPQGQRFAQMVDFSQVAWTAGGKENNRAIQIELPGKVGIPYDPSVIEYCSIFVAFVSQQWSIPLTKLTLADVRAAKSGICGHEDIPNPANSNQGGGIDRHTDPGNTFPWSQMLNRATALGGVKGLPYVPANPASTATQPTGTIGSGIGGGILQTAFTSALKQMLMIIIRAFAALIRGTA